MYFNPHSRTGSDKGALSSDYSYIISIHTPAQGVTIRIAIHAGVAINFNPHSRTGSDRPCQPRACAGRYFNPHSRTGSDPVYSPSSVSFPNFNPHSRTGSDLLPESRRGPASISIHTPAQGVTSSFWSFAVSLRNFNPHSRTGSDQGRADRRFYAVISIHTPAQGVTGGGPLRQGAAEISIHTPAQGVTPKTYKKITSNTDKLSIINNISQLPHF